MTRRCSCPLLCRARLAGLLALVAGACGAPPAPTSAPAEEDLATPADPPDLAPADAAAGPSGADLRAPDLRTGDLAPPDNPLVKMRPYTAYVPPSYDPARPAPLLLMLHGYDSSGSGHEGYFKLKPLADRAGFLYAYPDGTKDLIGKRFWNATDACCNLFKAKVDDVAYLGAVLDDMAARYNVDPKRVFVLGHSNGGFMAHRLACELAPRIAAIVSLAGDNYKDPAQCRPAEPVAVLQIHGDKDAVIKYAGGGFGILAPYPTAPDSVRSWAASNGCAADPDSGAPAVDIDSSLAGAETQVARYPGCRGGAAELWTVRGGPHEPPLAAGFQDLIWGFLSSHAKP